MNLIINTAFGEYVVPESVRTKIWDKIKLNGEPDRRFKSAAAINRYFSLVNLAMKRRFLNAD